MINTAGAHLKDGVELFASPIALTRETDTCGVARWKADPSSNSGGMMNQVCGFEDVNGDGLVDRISSITANGQVASVANLGTGVPSAPFSSVSQIGLPGPLACTESDL